jgi:recombination protein RecT
MANNAMETIDMKNAAQNSMQKQNTQKAGGLAIIKNLLSNESVKQRFENILKEKANGFMASILSLVTATPQLSKCDPNSIIAASLIAATFDLPINPTLGYAHIVPYSDKAAFQMGWKGYKQLAIRTGLYESINATDIRQGELGKRNRLTGDIELNFIEDEVVRNNTPIIGYAHYFRLTTGYKSILYMSMEQLMNHAKEYSKLYQSDLRSGGKNKMSKWSIDKERHFMCLKTVTKLNLASNGILSIDMQKAKMVDDAVVNQDGEVIEYPDGTDGISDAEVIEDNKSEEEAQDDKTKKQTPEVTEEENWESPKFVLKRIKDIETIKDYNAFIKNNKQKLETFGGSEKEIIDAALKNAEEKVINNK